MSEEKSTETEIPVKVVSEADKVTKQVSKKELKQAEKPSESVESPETTESDAAAAGSKRSSEPTPMWIANYNLVSGSMWSFILINTLLTGAFFGQPQMFSLTSTWLTLVQLCALVEVYNSAVGNVRSPLFTTVMQVASRLLIVIGIFQLLPYSPANFHWAYLTLSIAWSITEIIRYYYYAANILTEGNPPPLLKWLRYNTFTVLYPMGISSEVYIIISSLAEAAFAVGEFYRYFLIGCVAAYVPGAYVLYSYMLKQRSKVMSELKEKTE